MKAGMCPAPWKTPWSAQLERQFNMREAFPDHVDYFARWRRESDEARKALKPALDVPYGNQEREKLDIFPGGRAGAVLVFIHGGYWRTMDKSDFSFLARPFTSRGVTVVMPNYPFCPAASIGEIVAATRRMLAWVVANIAPYSGDGKQVNVAGWSAGAHLAAMLLAGDAPERARPRSVVAISGIYDLRPLRHVHANEDLRLTEEAAVANSPALLEPAHRARLEIVVGERETDAMHEQARSLANAWKSSFGGLSPKSIAGAHHYGVVSQVGDESSELFRLVLDQLGAGVEP